MSPAGLSCRAAVFRGLSTDPVLQNSAKPEQPQAPIATPAVDSLDGSVKVPPEIEKLANDILALNMMELNDLLKILKSRLGLKDDDLRGVAVAPGAGGAGAGGAAAGAAEEKPKEKENFDIKLVGFDEKSKIKVIKEIRTITGLGLKESKEMVEGVPKVIKKDVKKDEAEKLLEKLKEVGAKVELV